MKKEIRHFGVRTPRHVDFFDFWPPRQLLDQKNAHFFTILDRSYNSLKWKNGQKRPFLIIFSQCKRIPSPRGHQLHVFFCHSLVFFHLFYPPLLGRGFSGKFRWVNKIPLFKRVLYFLWFRKWWEWWSTWFTYRAWKKRLGILALGPPGMSIFSIFDPPDNFLTRKMHIFLSFWTGPTTA